MVLRLATCLLLASALPGCSRAIPRDFEISYENRGVGEGISRLYRFTLHHDGTVQYTGRRGVKLLGEQHGTIPLERVASLQHALEELGFFQLRDRYVEGSDGTMQVLEVTCDGKAKAVSFDGEASFLAALTPERCKELGLQYQPMTDVQLEHLRLEQFFDALSTAVGIEHWTGTEEEQQANHYWLERDRSRDEELAPRNR